MNRRGQGNSVVGAEGKGGRKVRPHGEMGAEFGDVREIPS
jgi:hypothetical protein